MTVRVIITDPAELLATLDRLDAVAAPRGWRVRRPADAAGVEARARDARAAMRLPAPVVVDLETDPDAAAADDPIDAAALLARTPVRGAIPDGARRLHGA
ncbi:cation transport ATPase [Microbacterium sp. TS-1]|uniref:Uncharacterized protein n=1 Tax=Microbacterium arborescens TaxID=33883 RepID=A0ABX2WL73_9MICO|nr:MULTISPECIES: hypothetical protein [Microbacterium]OAZ44006.1 hypothetical protein A9Z40_13500 [Microbacterium arborescens]QCR41486.1 hypothetical protein C1N74_14340 [Microbacterium sp. SGAir0570]GAD34898.1 cation transport ATPase [Microbacterium sp. TS-1]